jgi:hypothetical protein
MFNLAVDSEGKVQFTSSLDTEPYFPEVALSEGTYYVRCFETDSFVPSSLLKIEHCNVAQSDFGAFCVPQIKYVDGVAIIRFLGAKLSPKKVPWSGTFYISHARYSALTTVDIQAVFAGMRL